MLGTGTNGLLGKWAPWDRCSDSKTRRVPTEWQMGSLWDPTELGSPVGTNLTPRFTYRVLSRSSPVGSHKTAHLPPSWYSYCFAIWVSITANGLWGQWALGANKHQGNKWALWGKWIFETNEHVGDWDKWTFGEMCSLEPMDIGANGHWEK